MMEVENYGESDLLALPVEVLDTYILPYLRYADLLKIRKVCKHLKSLSDDFILSNFKNKYREINETNYTFHHYLQSNLTTSSIHLNNSSSAFFENPDIPFFLNRHGNMITHVKINNFSTFISEHELFFFSNLPNLHYLDITFIDATQRDCSSNMKLVNGSPVFVPNSPFPLLRDKSPFPPNFKNLKTLKLNRVQGSSRDDYGYPWDFLEFCENLQHFKHPLYISQRGDGFYNHSEGNLGWISDYIKRRINGNGLPNLETYDMENFQANEFCSKFITFVPLCFDNKVKLLNVSNKLLDQHPEFDLDLGERVNGTFVSLRNLPWCAVTKEMPSLEKLKIEKVSDTIWKNIDEGQAQRMMVDWPLLKSLDLNIDSSEIGERFRGNLDYRDHPLLDLYLFQVRKFLSQEVLDLLFFPGKRFDELRDLAIRFAAKLDRKGDEPGPVPNVLYVTETCRFVTKLTLGNWMGTDEQVVGFWKGLRFLEEVVLDECERIGDEAFVGEGGGWEDPEFLKLTKLRKVTFKGLDKMAMITDQLFKLVLRKLKIEQFCLTSEEPVKSVTVSGIESLLTGQFNDSVEKFPFTGWSLDGVLDETFMELKIKFRAYHMI